MITEIELQTAQQNVEYWMAVVASKYSTWDRCRAFCWKKKNEYNEAKKQLENAQKEYDRIWAILKDQDVNDLSNEFYSDQIEKSYSSSSSNTTIFVVVAVVVLGGLYFILKK